MDVYEPLPETAVEAYDRREQEHNHAAELERVRRDADIEIAKARRSEHRSDVGKTLIGTVGLLLAAVAAVGLVLWFISLGGSDESDKEIEFKREQTCIASGGGFVVKDLLGSGVESGICVFPGQSLSGATNE